MKKKAKEAKEMPDTGSTQFADAIIAEYGPSRITRPGKFEGEWSYVPYFWAIMLEGEGMECNRHHNCIWLRVLPTDRISFPMLRRRQTIHLCQRDDGFITEI